MGHVFDFLAEGEGGGIFVFLVWLAIVVLVIAGFWKTFEKAGHPGWAAIIPIYNIYILCLIAGRPGWWVILFLIPFVNFVIAIMISLDVARNFGKGAGFGIGLWLLPMVFYPILGFSDARFIGGQQQGFPVQPSYGAPPPR
jgi:hypothetical protein